MKPKITWILIANSREGYILENVGPGHGLHRVMSRTWSWEPGPVSSHEPGRSFDSHGAGRHKMEPHHGGGDEADFSRKLVQDLLEDSRKKKFDRLILCAPPSMLGALRREIPGELTALVSSELDKDLVPIPVKDLPAHFEDVLAV
ncbi:host attachment protein [Hoeflea sp. CAU 1731]